MGAPSVTRMTVFARCALCVSPASSQRAVPPGFLAKRSAAAVGVPPVGEMSDAVMNWFWVVVRFIARVSSIVPPVHCDSVAPSSPPRNCDTPRLNGPEVRLAASEELTAVSHAVSRQGSLLLQLIEPDSSMMK